MHGTNLVQSLQLTNIYFKAIKDLLEESGGLILGETFFLL